MARPIRLNRKYSTLSSAICLGLVAVVYYLYYLGELQLPQLSSGNGNSNNNHGSLQHSKPLAETKDDEIDAVKSPKPPPTATASLPADYSPSTFSESQQKCELFFTPAYLKHIATHQLPYCESESLSAFQCFTAPRLTIPMTGGWGPTDPLCIAQGVSFRPKQQTSSDEEFGIQCKLRNLAAERANSSDAATELEGFRDRPTDWGWYWGDTGVGASLKTWKFANSGDIEGCTREKSDSKEWVMLMRRDSTDTHNLWHKLMEILQARHSLDALRIAINPTTGTPWLSDEDAAHVQLVFDDDREELLEPLWEIVTGKKPIRKSSWEREACFGNVILPLPGCGSPFWSNLLDTGYPEACPSQTLLTTYVHRIFEFYGVVQRPVTEIHKHPNITIVERKENRKFVALDRWVKSLKERYPHSPINVVDFASITIQKQIELVQSTDILVGHHGAAMTHIIFMAPGAAAVEILPRHFDQHGFRSAAAMRGVNYIAGRCMHKEEYQNAVNGTPFPQGWTPPTPQEFNHWQKEEWTYLTDEDFLGLVDAAVRSQMNKLGSSDSQKS